MARPVSSLRLNQVHHAVRSRTERLEPAKTGHPFAAARGILLAALLGAVVWALFIVTAVLVGRALI